MSKYIIKGICPSCWGRGYVKRGADKVECDRCDGSGEVDRTINEVSSDGSRSKE